MTIALGLARRGLGTVWPNPAVGCVLVQFEDGTGRIVGRGWTQPGGRPHAETEALRRAGTAAKGAVAYVTLEPCCHHGKTPPCTDALIAAGVSRVVVAAEDPDTRVAGAGLRQISDAGIAVDCGPCGPEAEALNIGFLTKVRDGRPTVCLKTATTLDGRIATHTGNSQWITGPEARARSHRLRASYDAIMVGVGTAIADDPELTCRLPGLSGRSPVRIVVDAGLRLPLTAKLLRTTKSAPTWIIARDDADRRRADAIRELGAEVVGLPVAENGYPDPRDMLRRLGRRGITRLLVEGGATLAAVLLRADLIDRIAWFRSAGIIGGDGIPAVEPYGVDVLAEMARFGREGAELVGTDTLETLVRPH